MTNPIPIVYFRCEKLIPAPNDHSESERAGIPLHSADGRAIVYSKIVKQQKDTVDLYMKFDNKITELTAKTNEHPRSIHTLFIDFRRTPEVYVNEEAEPILEKCANGTYDMTLPPEKIPDPIPLPKWQLGLRLENYLLSDEYCELSGANCKKLPSPDSRTIPLLGSSHAFSIYGRFKLIDSVYLTATTSTTSHAMETGGPDGPFTFNENSLSLMLSGIGFLWRDIASGCLSLGTTFRSYSVQNPHIKLATGAEAEIADIPDGLSATLELSLIFF